MYQKVEYFNNVLTKLFISHVHNINNTIFYLYKTGASEYIEIEEASKQCISKSKTYLQYKYNWKEAKKKYPNN